MVVLIVASNQSAQRKHDVAVSTYFRHLDMINKVLFFDRRGGLQIRKRAEEIYSKKTFRQFLLNMCFSTFRQSWVATEVFDISTKGDDALFLQIWLICYVSKIRQD